MSVHAEPQTTSPPGRLGALHAPLRDKVAEEIRAAILSGHFKPGDRLIEDRLAEEFGVSRNPIREAMRTLASEGLIEVTARRGAVVASLSPQEAEELLEVRATLEGANARLASRRRDPVVLDRLKAILATRHRGDRGRARDRPARAERCVPRRIWRRPGTTACSPT